MRINKNHILYILLLILSIFLAFLSTTYDYDFFARIIVGEQFIESGILPYKDFLSYTPTHNWYDHEWGSGVVFYAILKYFKPIGLLFLQAFLIFGTSIFICKTQKLQKHAFPTSLLFMTSVLLIFAHINPNIIRCQMFSFFFFSVYLYLMEKYKYKQTNLIWLIPVLTIIWNNLHGGVVSGLGIIFIYSILAILEKKPWKNLVAMFAISCATLIINPYGIKYLNFLFSATTKNREYINEWWSFLAKSHFSYYFSASFFIITLLIILIYVSIKKHNINWTKLTICIVCSIQGLLHVKLLSLGLIATSALCYNELIIFIKKLLPLMKKIEKCLYPIVISLVLILPFLSPQIPRVNLQKFPFYETEFLKINNIKGNAVVPFGYGSYITYKLYPNILVYMDGRYEEVYYDKEFLALRDFSLAEKGWKEFLKQYDTEIIMVEKYYDIYKILQQDSNWVNIFNGKLCGVFLKKDLAQKEYIKPNLDKKYYQKNIFNNMGYFNVKNLHLDKN